MKERIPIALATGAMILFAFAVFQFSSAMLRASRFPNAIQSVRQLGRPKTPTRAP